VTVTDTYSQMAPDVSVRSVHQNTDFDEELGVLIRQQEELSDREKELSMYRSGSTPPTMEGSLSAVGGFFDASALMVLLDLLLQPGFPPVLPARVHALVDGLPNSVDGLRFFFLFLFNPFSFFFCLLSDFSPV
jgi:hypothetical protein